MMTRPTIYAIDFDGTIVENAFPGIGKLKPEALATIRALKARGDKWILYTMREDGVLDEALDFLKEHKLMPDAVNDNLPEMKEYYANNPRKVYADVYIDDHNAGGLQFCQMCQAGSESVVDALADALVESGYNKDGDEGWYYVGEPNKLYFNRDIPKARAKAELTKLE